jgi:hypothetical protein
VYHKLITQIKSRITGRDKSAAPPSAAKSERLALKLNFEIQEIFKANKIAEEKKWKDNLHKTGEHRFGIYCTGLQGRTTRDKKTTAVR